MEKSIAVGGVAGEGLDYSAFESAVGLNWYQVDPNLRFLADRLVASEDRQWVEGHLQRMGALCGGPIAARAEISDKHPPVLERYDAWGNEVNRIAHHPTVLDTKRDLWDSGFIGLPWSDEAKQRGRPFPPMLGVSFYYLLSQAETGMLCSIGMTTALARVLEMHAPAEVRDRFLPHLTAMSYADGWDGAMFMTEVKGGSDLATSETQATYDGKRWLLSGSKWFCSNVDAQVILTLARPQGAQPGWRGLALFLVPATKPDGSPNGIRIKRVKDKLGTRCVPTAEVDFVDAEAYLVAGERSDVSDATDGRGLNRMMDMVTESRLGVAIMGLGIARRSFLDAAIYAADREAFGRRIDQWPAVRETLVQMAVETEAAAALVFEAGQANASEDGAHRLSRMLTPLAKFRAARRGLELASQAVEIFGGNGYIENWPVARQLRDGQCHTIWEGAENIICLDIQRAMIKEAAHEALLQRVESALSVASDLAPSVPALRQPIDAVEQTAREVREVIAYLARSDRDVAMLHARRLAGYLADLAQAALLLEEAVWETAHRGSARKALVARIFADTHLVQRPLRGITSGDRTAIDHFDAIVRYQPVPAEAI
jgi:alkylation response protein AidB-like acyl-CoA dehydrogenase